MQPDLWSHQSVLSLLSSGIPFLPKSQVDKKENSKPHTYLSSIKSNSDDLISTKIIINHMNVVNLNFMGFIPLFWILYVNLFCKRAISIKSYTWFYIYTYISNIFTIIQSTMEYHKNFFFSKFEVISFASFFL